MKRIKRLSEELSLSEAGGKACNLSQLLRAGFPVPEGIVLTAQAATELLQGTAKTPEQIRALRLPTDLLEEIWGKLPTEAETRFAVRSSGLAEDGENASFAGQYLTRLEVKAPDLEEAILACLASSREESALAYGALHEADANPEMAVLIQVMVPAESAGVAFSVDPVKGRLDHTIIEAAPGLGEAVVSGENHTEVWTLDSKTWEVLERRGPAEIFLEPQDLLQVGEMTRRVHGFFAAPQDLEWALAEGKLYLLQARPVTSIAPHFTRDESAERFPEPLTPLTWDYVESAFNDSLEFSLDLMDITLPTRPWFAQKNCYIYGNQNAVKLLGARTVPELNSLQDLEALAPLLSKNLQRVGIFAAGWQRRMETFLESSRGFMDQELEGKTMAEFQKYSHDMFSASRDYFLPNIAVSMMQSALAGTLYRVLGLLLKDPADAGQAFHQILAGAPTKTGEINGELRALAREAAGNLALARLLKSGGTPALAGLEGFPEFSAHFWAFIQENGHRENTFDYYYPTWAEAPETVLDLITATMDTSPGRKEVKEPKGFLELVPGNFRPLFLELCERTLEMTSLDDLEHFQTTRMNLMARRALAYPGRILKEQGALEDVYDLFFLKKEELESLTEFSLSEDLRLKIERRKAEFMRAKASTPAWDLESESAPVPATGEEHLMGVPGSPGEIEGPVYIVRGPQDFAGMPEGAILVARTTNPAWTPLFFKAAGVLTESGGPLSHGAVTARELGKPAVLSLHGALELFENGEVLRINGRTGAVLRVGQVLAS